MFVGMLLACVIDRTGASATHLLAEHTRAIAALQADAAGLAKRVGTLEEVTRARGQDAILRMETMEQLRQEVANVRGDLEVLQKGVHDAGLSDRGFQEDTVARLAAAEARVATLEATLGVGAAPPSTAPRTPAEASGGSAPAKDPDAVVDAIEKALGDDKPGVARTLAKAFLAEHPKHARAAEVQYRLAESHDNEKDYKVAAAAYQVVVDAYPGSTWAGWALLRQGECFDSLKRPEDAAFFYEDVVKRFPKHKAAKEAKAKLQARKR
ncbi:MAG: hypothetical protein RLZZ299_953 [Pseudomonadota bacterium]|jgi:TolA-binding protein